MANNFKQGYAEVGGKTYWFRSGFEVRWAQYLELLKGLGEIIDWLYEPKTYWFWEIKRGTRTYKPDFRIVEEDCHYWHETKGHLTQKSVTQLKRMAKYYPNEKIFLVMQNIPKKPTRKNAEKLRRLANAKKYVERVMNGSEILKQVGL